MKINNSLYSTAKTKLLLAAFLLLGISQTNHASAQCVIPPTFADNIVGPAGSPNSSTIDYTPFCTIGCSTTNSQLTAVVMGGPGAPPPMLFVNDQVMSGWLPSPVPAPPISVPDVVVGNDLSTPGNYIVAVVFTLPLGAANDVFLTTYTVTGVGTGSLLVSPPTAPINISGTGNVVGATHIDIIAQYSTPFFGLPLANNFVVTWQDQTQGIMAYSASLNAPSAGTPWIVDGNLNCSSPDVAGIEIAGPQNFAVFSYVDQTVSPNILYENESFIGGPSLGPIVYDNTHTYFNVSPQLSVARIDAIDDFTKNSLPGIAYFDIVAAAPDPAFINVLEYNNVTGPFVATNINTPLACIPPGSSQSVNPTVTCGPGNIYTVGYFTQGMQDYYTQAINWTTGLPPGAPALEYQIPMNTFAPSPGLPWGIALSGTNNTNTLGTQNLFATWENGGALWEKYTVLPYAFKESSPTGVSTIKASTEWQLYPNPVTDNMSLIAPAGFDTNEGGTYGITDMAGRLLIQGTINKTAEKIDTRCLSAGMYLLNVQSGKEGNKTIKFAKD